MMEDAMHMETNWLQALELHLFFGRIMKEHALFLKAGFTPVNPSFSRQAEYYKKEFENLLHQAVLLSNGLIRCSILESGELVTEFTMLAEKQTEHLTGISINQAITAKELQLTGNDTPPEICFDKRCQIHRMNQMARKLLDGLIAFKEQILENALCGKMFTVNYPLLLEHIIREAKLYRDCIQILEKDGCLTSRSMKDTECFWNRIMMEHALFIRGLLDPCETQLFDTADGFAKDFSALISCCQNGQNQTDVLEKTIQLRDFKAAGAQGIQQCKIRSVILPLLADHVLREANHYIRILKE